MTDYVRYVERNDTIRWHCKPARLLPSIVLLCWSLSAHAELQWNFYGTLGFGIVNDESVVSNSNLAYSNFTENLTGEDLTRFGAQASYLFNEKLSLTLQAVSRQSDGLTPEIEWGYLNYGINDNTSIKAGLLRRSLFQYTDSLFVGYGARWVQPPSSVYLNIDEFYGNISALNLLHNGAFYNWLYSTELYAGTGTGKGTFAGQKTENDAKHNVGLILGLERDNYTLRLGAHRSDFSLSIDGINQVEDTLRQFGLNELADDVILEDETAHFYSIGGSYLTNDWEFFGEKVAVDIQDTYVPKIKAWYVGVQRSFNRLAVHYTIGEQNTRPQLDPGSDILELASQTTDPVVAGTLAQIGQQLTPLAQMSHASRFSNAIGVRYDFNSAFALKAELERVTDRVLNEDAHLFSFSVDFVY